MPTIITIPQGGTGTNTIQGIKSVLGLKSAAFLEVSDEITSELQSTVATSLAVKLVNDRIESASKEVIPVSRGGTGATTPEQARSNLGIIGTGGGTTIDFPVSIPLGGTGAVSVDGALNNLGITFPIPIANGGTGAITVPDALKNLGLSSPLKIEHGGTGHTSIIDFINEIGLTTPIPISSGGTGGIDIFQARTNLKFNELMVTDINGKDLNEIVIPGFYYSSSKVLNTPSNTAGFFLIVNECTPKNILQVIVPADHSTPGFYYRTVHINSRGASWTRWFEINSNGTVREGEATLSGNTLQLDLASGAIFKYVVSSNTVISFLNTILINSVSSISMLRLTNGGAYTITWPNGLKWSNGIAPKLTVSGTDEIYFMYFSDGTMSATYSLNVR